ncbi:MAG: acyl-CoA dehydrogenase, partial [Acidimicrobiia bacterium]
MEFAFSPRVEELRSELTKFMDEMVFPAEASYRLQMEESGDPNFFPPVIEDLKKEARSRGLWNLFLPDESGLSVSEYAPLAEITG